MRILFFLAALLVFFANCSNDDEYYVVLEGTVAPAQYAEIYTPTRHVVFTSGYWKDEKITKAKEHSFTITCRESDALLTGKITVDGKLLASNFGNSPMRVVGKIK